MKSKAKSVRKKRAAVRVQRSVRRPACVLFSVREANETDISVMKKLAAAGCEIVVVQEQHFDAALKAIEAVRRRPPND